MKRAYGYWGEPSEDPPPPRSFAAHGNSGGVGGVFARDPAPPPLPQPTNHEQQYYDDYFYDGDGDGDDLRLGADAGLNAFEVGEGDGGGGYGGGFAGFGGGGDSGWGGGGGGFEAPAPPPPPPPPPPQQRRAPPAAWAVQAVRDAAAAAAGVPVTGGPALSSFAAGGGWPPPQPQAPPPPLPPRPGAPPPQQHHQHHQPQNPPPRSTRRPTRFLAVCYGGGGAGSHHQNQPPSAAATVGLAFFDAASRELSLLQRPDERRGPAAFEVLAEAVQQLRPHVLCLSAKAGADVVAACRRALAQASQAVAARPGAATAEDDDDEDAPAAGGHEPSTNQEGEAAPTLVYERAALFGYDQALVALSSALGQQQQQQQQSSGGAGNGNGNGNAATSSPPDLSPSAALQVCAGGALVSLLRRERVLAPDDADDDEDANTAAAAAPPPPPQLLRCAPLALPARVDVSPDALRLLGVFRATSHPSRMGIGAAKREGRGSLFALLSSRCKTNSGRRLLRHWLSRPLADLPLIAARHDAVTALLRAPREPWRALERALAPAQDLAALVARLRLAQGRPDPAAYRQLLAALAALRQLRDAAAVLLLDDGGGGYELDEDDEAAAVASSIAGGGGVQAAASGRRHSRRPCNDNTPPPLVRLPAASRLHAAVDDAAFAECARLVEETLEVGGLSGPAAAAAGGGVGSAAAAALVEGGTLVRPGVCPQLDRLRAAYHALPDALTAAVDAELARVPPSAAMAHAAVVAPPQPSSSSLASGATTTANPANHPPPVSRIRFSILYLPQVGFVLAVGGGRLGPSMLAALPDYEYAFCNSETGASFTAFYCCDATRALNRRWGDLMWRIQDLEAAISAALVRRILDGGGGGGGGEGVGAALLAAAPAVAELDCLSALAACARDHGWVRPQVTRGTRLDVVGGRDPLVEARRLRLEGSAAGVVPNDALIGSDDDDDEGEGAGGGGGGGNGSGNNSSPRVLVVMGPNASGKTVFARQAVLVALLAHVGSFVPAQRATVGLADRLIVVAAGAGGGVGGGPAGGVGAGGASGEGALSLAGRRPSSFQADLLRMGAAMRAATRRSIVLLDEFGSGTLSCDGAGLLAAVLEAWGGGRSGAGAGQGSPRVLACTHFTELFDPRVLDPRRASRLRFLSMGVVVRGGEGEDGEGGGGGGGLGASRARSRRPQPVFLYRAEPNPTRAAPAFGVECARLAGVPPCVTSRAAVVLAAMTGSAGSAVGGAADGAAATATTATALPRLLPRGVAPLPMPGAEEDNALAERLAEGLKRVRLDEEEEEEDGGGGAEGDEGGAAKAMAPPTLRSLLEDALGYELGQDVAAELATMAT